MKSPLGTNKKGARITRTPLNITINHLLRSYQDATFSTH